MNLFKKESNTKLIKFHDEGETFVNPMNITNKWYISSLVWKAIFHYLSGAMRSMLYIFLLTNFVVKRALPNSINVS